MDNYNKIIELVKTRITLETRLNNENNPNTINIIKRQIWCQKKLPPNKWWKFDILNLIISYRNSLGLK